MPWIDLPSTSVLCDSAWRGVVVLVVAVIGYWLTRRSSASHRHLVLASSIFVLVIIPVVTARLPGWELRTRLGTFDTASKTASADSVPVRPLVRDAEPKLDVRSQPSDALAADEPNSSPSSAHAVESTASEPVPETPLTVVSVSSILKTIRQIPQPMTWLPAVWFCGFSVVLFPTFIGLLQLRRIKSRSTAFFETGHNKQDGGWFALAETLRGELKIRRQVRLLSSSHFSVPMTWGLVRPSILLPEDANEWPESRRRIVLLHEMAHIRRFDWATNLVGEVARALHWFDPLVWFMVRRLRLESEKACDDLVVRNGTAAADYAAELMHFIEQARAGFDYRQALPITRKLPSFQQRIHSMLDTAKPRESAGLVRVGLFTLVCLGATIPLATACIFDEPELVILPTAPATTVGSGTTNASPARPNLPVRKRKLSTMKFDELITGTKATKEQLKLPFGPPLKNGLRLAWVVSPQTTTYVNGDILSGRVYFLNDGRETFEFKRHHDFTFSRDEVDIRFTDGRKSHAGAFISFMNRPQRYLMVKLEPGELIEVPTDGIVMGQRPNGLFMRTVDAKVGDEGQLIRRIPIPQFKPPLEGPRSSRLESAPIRFKMTAGVPNTVVKAISAIRPGVYQFADGIRLKIQKGHDEKDKPVNAVTIQWFDGEREIPTREKVIRVPGLDHDFAIAWGEGPGAYRYESAHRFWIAKANAVSRVLVRSRDDAETHNYPWSMHENFGKDVHPQHTNSGNYGGIPATVMAELESLKPKPVAINPPKASLLSVVDFSRLPAKTWWAAGHELPDLHVVDPNDSFNWQRASDVYTLPVGDNTWIQYAFDKNHYYIEYRPDGSWEFEQTYGPIEGDPFEQLKLDAHLQSLRR